MNGRQVAKGKEINFAIMIFQKKFLIPFTTLMMFFVVTEAMTPVDSVGVVKEKNVQYTLHKVVAKENWFSIARKYGVAYTELKVDNPEFGNTLKIGDVIKVNRNRKEGVKDLKKNEMYTIEKTPVYHTVKSKETLSLIAKKYKVNVEQIKKWNKLKGNNIKPKQKLVVGYNEKKVKAPEVVNENKKTETVLEKREVKTTTEVPSVKNVPDSTKKINEENPETIADSLNEEDRKEIFANGRIPVNETGVASWIEDGDINPNKYYALHRSAPVGTIIKLTNKMNKRFVFVKVIGRLPDTGDNDNLIIKISKAASDKMGVLDLRFAVDLLYGVNASACAGVWSPGTGRSTGISAI